MDHLLACDEKLIQFYVSEANENNNTSIATKVWSLSGDEGSWCEDVIVFPFPETKSHITVKILLTKNCKEIRTGLYIPVALLHVSYKHEHKQKCHLCLFGLNLLKRKFIPLQKTPDFTDGNTYQSPAIVDGPYILWIQNGSVFICVPRNDPGKCHSQLLKFPNEIGIDYDLLWSGYHDAKLVFITKFGEKNGSLQAFYLDENCLTDTKFACECTPIKQFHFPYPNIVKIYIDELETCSRTNSSDLTQTLLSSFFAVTDESYLLKFKQGRLLYAVPLGDHSISSGRVDIQLLQSYGHHSKVLVYFSEWAFLIDTKEKQVIKTWDGIITCQCGDFVGVGYPQLLLLTDNFNTSSGWLLTDGVSVFIDKQSGLTDIVPENHHPEGDSSHAVINALQDRLKNDLVLLHEKRQEVTTKKNFISTTWGNLQKNIQGEQLCKAERDPTMMAVIHTRKAMTSTPLGRKPKVKDSDYVRTVTDVWQRVVDGQWVVGVDCVSNRTLSYQVRLTKPNHVMGSLVYYTDNPQNCSMTDLNTRHEGEGRNDELPGKKPRLNTTQSPSDPEQEELFKETSVACVAKLPNFGGQREVSCYVSLCVQKSDIGAKVGKLGDRSPCQGAQKEVQSIGCGTICLTVDDILSEIYHVKMDRRDTKAISRDVTALNLTQTGVRLKLKTTTTFTQENFKSCLESRASFTFCPLFNCYMSTVRSLVWVRLELVDEVVDDETRFVLFARDEEQIALTLHHLYSYLPDNILIVPDDKQAISRSLKVSVKNMVKELSFLTSAIREFNNTRSNKPTNQHLLTEEEKNAHGQVDVEKVRTTYAKRKRELVQCDTVNIDNMEEMSEELVTLEMCTDRVMIDLHSM